jgi:thioredoxin-like negative regulator of GroEL
MDDLNEESFEPFVTGAGLRLVIFGARACQPARDQRKDLEETLGRQAAPPRVAAIDALVHDGVRRKMNIRRLPTTIVFRDGEVAAMLQGYQAPQRIEALVRSVARVCAFAA